MILPIDAFVSRLTIRVFFTFLQITDKHQIQRQMQYIIIF